ncbi:hypothetical protein MM221_03655 [Salipaludibacillus sp. LMS25]|nr:hypothetical protein MM221_03655 [Salipaludibacillus sp. LMS25]
MPQGEKLVVEHSNDKIAHTHTGRPHLDENQFTFVFNFITISYRL